MIGQEAIFGSGWSRQKRLLGPMLHGTARDGMEPPGIGIRLGGNSWGLMLSRIPRSTTGALGMDPRTLECQFRRLCFPEAQGAQEKVDTPAS